MKEGLLWFDNDPKRPLADKIGQAAARYQVKFGAKPNTCYINEKQSDGRIEVVGDVRLKVAKTVSPNHFFIGVENS